MTPRYVLMLTAAATTMSAPSFSQVTSDFEACGEIAADGERLACFDAALAGLSTRKEEAAEQSKVRATEAFGLRENQIEEVADVPDLSEEQRSDLIESGVLNLTVLETLTDRAGKRVFIFDNGQIWRETRSQLRGSIKDGQLVEISKGGIGGYRLRVEGRNGFVAVVRVK